MKLFASKFYQTLVFNVATIAAIVVGVCQFLIRAYNENNGPEKVRKVMQTVLRYVATFTVYACVSWIVSVSNKDENDGSSC